MLNLRKIFKKEKKVIDYYSSVLFTDQLTNYYKNVWFDNDCLVTNPGYIKIGNNSTISHHAAIHAIKSESLKSNPTIEIGERTYIGPWNVIIACNKIIIGNNVLFGPYVHVNDQNHGYEDVTKPIMDQLNYSRGSIIIEDECWLGFGCHILSGGITIGKHSVIGANSVVTKSIPPYSVAVGMPAKVIKQYDFNKKAWLQIR